jgi:flavin-dependent dehydrogenase
VEIGAYYLEKVLGLEQHIHQHHLPKFGLRFYFNHRDATQLGDGLELGLACRFDTPSYQLDRGRLENFMAADMDRLGVTFCDSCAVVAVDLDSGGKSHRVRYRRDGREQTVRARWLVDASGRRGFLKQRLGLKEEISHGINAVWFRLNAAIRVDDWDPWRGDERGRDLERWLSTNHLMGPGYWVWLIPLASGATSIGIVADPDLHPLQEMNRFDRAMDWLARHEPLCARHLEPHRDTLMDFLAVKHFAHGCRQLFSTERWALTGEAGMFLDPFYSPGSDFIAINNTFIAALIEHDLKGGPLGARVQLFNELYRAFLLQHPAHLPGSVPHVRQPGGDERQDHVGLRGLLVVYRLSVSSGSDRRFGALRRDRARIGANRRAARQNAGVLSAMARGVEPELRADDCGSVRH